MLSQTTPGVDERTAFEACVAREVGLATGLTTADLDLSQQALDEADYRQRMTAQLAQTGATLVCVSDHARTEHDTLMRGEGLVVSPAERRARQLRQMRRAGGMCALAADEMEATGLGSALLGVNEDTARVLEHRQELLAAAEGVFPDASGIVETIVGGLVVGGALLLLDRYLDSVEAQDAAQNRIDTLGQQVNQIWREIDRFDRDLTFIRDLQGEMIDGSVEDLYTTWRLRNGDHPELSGEAMELLEIANAGTLDEAEAAVLEERGKRAGELRDKERELELALEALCENDGSCDPNPEPYVAATTIV